MKLCRWIGLSGCKEVGKDTAAQILISRGYHRIAFADPLRRIALAIDPFIVGIIKPIRLTELVAIDGWDVAKQQPEVRRLLQRIGTEAGREVLGDDVWVEAADREAAAHDRVVFTDVRFDNEASYIRRNGGVVVKIERPGKGGDSHASERGISAHLIDATVSNDSTIDDLHARLIEAASR